MREGEVLSDIILKRNISREEMEALNPGVNLDKLTGRASRLTGSSRAVVMQCHYWTGWEHWRRAPQGKLTGRAQRPQSSLQRGSQADNERAALPACPAVHVWSAAGCVLTAAV